MILELFGLPATGKSTVARELAREYDVRVIDQPHGPRLVVEAFPEILRHPVRAARFLLIGAKVSGCSLKRSWFINMWLGTHAKYARARRAGGIIDQGFAQAIIAALPQSRDIESAANALPHDSLYVLCEAADAVRQDRLKARGRVTRDEFGARAARDFAERAPRVVATLATAMRRHPDLYIALHPVPSTFVSRTPRTWPASHGKTLLLLASAGIARLFIRKPEVAVLMYHAVDTDGWKLSIHPREFERQMAYIARKKNPVSVAAVVAYAKGQGNLPSGSVAVTFDDGYRDLLMALPVLERYRIPATVFVPSDLSVQTGPHERPRLTREELVTLAESPFITIGSHARSHLKLSSITLSEAEGELRSSADELEAILGARPRFFAYPYGDRSRSVESAARKEYEASFAITEGLIIPGADLMRLPRVQVDATVTPMQFRLRLTSALVWNRRIVNLIRLRFS